MGVEVVVNIDYYLTASAADKPVCFGCGRPDPGSLATPPWPAIRDHLERHARWKPEELAAEALRFQALSDAGVPVVLCDDCWLCGYNWTLGEAEQLHNRARRFAHETEKDYFRRHAKRIRWANIDHADRKQRILRSAAFRWDYVWLLNNPGSELPYEAAP